DPVRRDLTIDRDRRRLLDTPAFAGYDVRRDGDLSRLMLIKSAQRFRAIAALGDSAKIPFGLIGVRWWQTTQSADRDDGDRRPPAADRASRGGPDCRAIPEEPGLKVRAARSAPRASRDRKANAAKQGHRASPACGATRVRPASCRRSSR